MSLHTRLQLVEKTVGNNSAVPVIVIGEHDPLPEIDESVGLPGQVRVIRRIMVPPHEKAP